MVAVSIQVDYNQLLRRITGRRNLPSLPDHLQHLHKPAPSGLAFVMWKAPRWFSEPTTRRRSLRSACALMQAQTAPVVEHYRELGRFAEVDGDGPIAAIAAGIVAAVERLRS